MLLIVMIRLCYVPLPDVAACTDSFLAVMSQLGLVKNGPKSVVFHSLQSDVPAYSLPSGHQ